MTKKDEEQNAFLKALKDEINEKTEFICEYPAKEINGYIWVKTPDGMIGDEACHYEVIFHDKEDGNPDVASVEVHFEKNKALKQCQGIKLPKKLRYDDWWIDGKTENGRIVYTDKDEASESKNTRKEIIKRLRELDRLIGQDLRAALCRQLPDRDQTVISETVAFRRNPALAKKAIKRSDYKCEICAGHQSFIASDGKPYMEAHHLIPLSKQDDFKKSLNQVGNIVCLCPNCHKEIHYGQNRNGMLKDLLEKRTTILEKIELGITLKELQRYYP